MEFNLEHFIPVDVSGSILYYERECTYNESYYYSLMLVGLILIEKSCSESEPEEPRPAPTPYADALDR
jgi:hypothetical protein